MSAATMKTKLLLVLLLGFTPSLFGGVETVLVVKVLDSGEKGIVQRRNGERWLIEKGAGAVSFGRYEGKEVLIHSPGIFCGVGSKLMLPDAGQEARIWNAEHIGDGDDATPPPAGPRRGTQFIARAFAMLKYYDPADPKKSEPEQVVKGFQSKHKLKVTGTGDGELHDGQPYGVLPSPEHEPCGQSSSGTGQSR